MYQLRCPKCGESHKVEDEETYDAAGEEGVIDITCPNGHSTTYEVSYVGMEYNLCSVNAKSYFHFKEVK